jgi:hypothetical protein
MEDRLLEEQLRSIAWGATFAPGPSVLPSGFLPPRDAAANNQAAHPSAPHTGMPRAGNPLPAGWSSGATAVIAAPRQPWFTPIPAATVREAVQVQVQALQQGSASAVPVHMGIVRPIKLRPRDDSPAGAGGLLRPDPPIAVKDASSASQTEGQQGGAQLSQATSAGGAAAMIEQEGGWQTEGVGYQQSALTQTAGVLAASPAPPLPVPGLLPSSTWAGDAFSAAETGSTAPALGVLPPPRGSEALASRLITLLAARRAAAEQAHLQQDITPDGYTPRSVVTEAGGQHHTLTNDLDQHEREVAHLAALTIAVHKGVLERRHRALLGASPHAPGRVVGKGRALAWREDSSGTAGREGRLG